MALDKVYKDLIWQNPDRVSGAICFYGTRLPVKHMFEHLEGGYKLDEFCSVFNVPLAQAKAVLDLASKGLDTLFEEAA